MIGSEDERIMAAHRRGDALAGRGCRRLTCCTAFVVAKMEVVIAEAEVVRRRTRCGLKFCGHRATAGGESDGTIAVEVLVEDGLEVLQRRAAARDTAGEIGDVVAVAVGAPDVEEPGGSIVEGDVVSASDMLGGNRCPAGPHADGDRSAIEY